MRKKSVLFLCTGNSCRSQMAEAIVNAQVNHSWHAYSAGTHPANQVHPKTIRVLQEIGIQHDGVPKHLNSFAGMSFDLVITVCDSAAEECPTWLGKNRQVHFSFPDPAKAEGSEEDVLNAFRQVRDQIICQIPVFLEDLTSHSYISLETLQM